MIHAEAFGWAAAALMVSTFACRQAQVMRPLAVVSNLAFISYGVLAALPPVFALHLLLLPINVWRWRQCLIEASPRAQTAGAARESRVAQAPPRVLPVPETASAHSACPCASVRVFRTRRTVGNRRGPCLSTSRTTH